MRCPNIEYSTVGRVEEPVAEIRIKENPHKSQTSNTPNAQLSPKQRAWNWTAIGFAAGENSAPVHNKRNLRMMELKLRMGWDRGTIEIT